MIGSEVSLSKLVKENLTEDDTPREGVLYPDNLNIQENQFKSHKEEIKMRNSDAVNANGGTPRKRNIFDCIFEDKLKKKN